MALAAIFQIGSLGDTIVSIPALLSIKELLPDCSEYLLVSRFETSVKIAPVHVFDMVWKPRRAISYLGSGPLWRRILSTASAFVQLRYYRPRYAVYLMPVDRTPRQIKRDIRFFRAAGIRELIGFRTLADSEMWSTSKVDSRDTQAYLRFRRLWNERSDEKFPLYKNAPLLAPGCRAQGRVKEWLHANRRWPERRLLGFSPYSNQPSKNLSQPTVAELIARLEASMGVEVVILGGGKDWASAEAARAVANGGCNACGVFSLEESAALLQMCNLAVCVDSGPMHLAGALGLSCVVPFSRMNEQLCRWLPLGTGHKILYRDVPCAGCKLAQCEVEGHPCMNGISTNQIIAMVANKLNGESVSHETMHGTLALDWPPKAELQSC